MKNQSVMSILKEVSIFSILEESELKALEEISYTSKYKKDSTLFIQGDVSNHLILLVDGLVSVFKNDDKGNEIIIGYFNKYSLLAEAAILKHGQLPSSAKFHTDGAIIKINLQEF